MFGALTTKCSFGNCLLKEGPPNNNWFCFTVVPLYKMKKLKSPQGNYSSEKNALSVQKWQCIFHANKGSCASSCNMCQQSCDDVAKVQ
jgi:hypothetical protein